MNKYLITGFSGFVARHFVEYLETLDNDCQVKGVDIREPNFSCDDYNLRPIFEKVDLLEQDRVERIVHEFQPNYILHLASFSSVAFSWKDPVRSFQNNTNIFLNLVNAVRTMNIDTRILSIGSSEEYGNVNNDDLPLREDHELKPVSPYAVARMAQEYLSSVYVNGYGMDIVLTRSFNHIGPMQSNVFVIPSLAKQLVEIKRSGKDRGSIITGDISIVRDFTDVRDVVCAYHLLLEKGRKGLVYNVCSGKGLSLKNVIDIMASQLNMEVEIHVDPHLIRPAESRTIVGSNERIRQELGWVNKISLHKSLRDVIDFWETSLT